MNGNPQIAKWIAAAWTRGRDLLLRITMNGG